MIKLYMNPLLKSAFIHDENKQRIIEACSIAYHKDQVFLQNITIYRKNNTKRIQNSLLRLAPSSKHLKQ